MIILSVNGPDESCNKDIAYLWSRLPVHLRRREDVHCFTAQSNRVVSSRMRDTKQVFASTSVCQIRSKLVRRDRFEALALISRPQKSMVRIGGELRLLLLLVVLLRVKRWRALGERWRLLKVF